MQLRKKPARKHRAWISPTLNQEAANWKTGLQGMGRQYMGVCSRDELTEVLKPYNTEKDITLYKDPAVYGKILLRAGDFALLAPEDGHEPSVSVSTSIPMKKIVLKVPV